LFNPVPPEFCNGDASLKYGFYRVLDVGKYELISVCNPEAAKMIGIHESEAQKFIPQPRKP